jgi:hypothetical protein
VEYIFLKRFCCWVCLMVYKISVRDVVGGIEEAFSDRVRIAGFDKESSAHRNLVGLLDERGIDYGFSPLTMERDAYEVDLANIELIADVGD